MLPFPTGEDACLALTCALIERPSVTPEDAGCLDLIARWLAPLGFVCTRMDVGGVRNLWARRGEEGPLLCFAGHCDVVPPGPLAQWTTPPFQPDIRDGKLFGRGAADMKSSLAAMVLASARFLSSHPAPRGSLAFLFTSDEEGDAIDGTAHVVHTLAARGERMDYCVVGEPTSVEHLGDMCKIGRRGSLSGLLRIHGQQGHVAYPERVRNAAHLALPALTALVATQWDEGDAHFPPTSLQISNVHAGTGAGNVAPGLLEAHFNVRFSPASPALALQQRIEKLLREALRTHGAAFSLTWTLGAQPFLTSGHTLADALRDAVTAVTTRVPVPSTTGGTSDGRFIVDICPEVIEFGPCNGSIHQVDEHIRVADLDALANIYQGIMTRLLG